jgi:hypothetical protein
LGSGAGEKRKSDHEYSTNTHTVRARERSAKITRENPYKAAIERAKTADNSFVTREVKKFKATDAFQKLSKDEQVTAEAEKRAMLKRQR